VGVMIAVTKSGDTGAYFTGRALGRHKLIPKLSPGKTWEGAVGGVVFATLVAWLCLRFLMPDQSSANAQPSIEFLSHPFYGALVLGPVLAVAGMLGDLAESMVKRECGAKDSGHWLPGMGGVWDVTDSLIAASLPAYLLFASGVGW
ncbi:MAG: phosphatidate cytidylyltransferase, partial [Planctomycetota bacterium]